MWREEGAALEGSSFYADQYEPVKPVLRATVCPVNWGA